jgi:hypothetical protein
LNGAVDTYEGWKALRSRVDALPRDRQAAFALACAQGTVGRDAGLLGSLESGWDALVNGGDATQSFADLERGHDPDDDAVAATHYALSSVNGEAGAAWWAASRAMDQAFASVEYPEDTVAFHPVEADALSTLMQSAITRQLRLLQIAESARDLSAAVAHLRSNENS